MTIDFAYIREAELIIQPYKDDFNSGTGKSTIVRSDGSRRGLKISFNIQKTILGGPNQSTISIYNLGPPKRLALAKELNRIELNVGWQNRKLLKLASGGLLSVKPDRSGTEIKTDIIFFDGYAGLVKGISQKTFGGGTQVIDIVKTIASDMPGVTVIDSRIDIEGAVGSRGRVVNGRSKNELDKLSEEYGFSWSVQNGVFQAIDDKRSFTRTIEISNKKKNLFKAEPMLSGPAQQIIGVEITALLDSNVSPGDNVKLISDVNPALNGTYKIHNISYNGDTFSDTWEMKIQSFKVF